MVGTQMQMPILRATFLDGVGLYDLSIPIFLTLGAICCCR
jgi:hypothetical protein